MSSRWISAARNKAARAALAAVLMLGAGAASGQPAGAPAEAMRYPYVAALYRASGNDQVFFCAGTMIAPQWIATAAHCFFARGGRIPDADLGAVVGRDDLTGVGKEAQVGIARIVIHPGYDSDSQANDIALIRLSEIAGPLIAEPAAAGSRDPAEATVLGFGSFYEGELAGQALTASGMPAAQSSRRLRQSVVDALAPGRCAALTGRSELDPTRICAGAGPRDACVGDSGGPLVARIPDGEDRLIGIVSLGSGCAVDDPVVVYTRVADYAGWIAATLMAD